MCKVGGPRCSADTRRSLDAARQRQEAVRKRVARLAELGREPLARLRESAVSADARVQRWQALYDSTPDGQAELASARDAATGEERQKLAARLDRAERLRQQELQAARERRRERQGDDDERSRDDARGGHADGARPGSVPARPGASAGGDAGGSSGGDSGGVAGRGYFDGDGARSVLIGGREVAAHRVSESTRAAELRERGVPVPEVYQLDGEAAAGGFRASLALLAEGNRYAASVSVYDESDYRTMRLYSTDDGKAGFAVNSDDVVSVYVRSDSEHRGSAVALLAAAVSEGGRRLDCYDTVLPRIYASAGFVPVARLAWDDDYAPDGWDRDTYARFNAGRPDVVFMAYSPESVDGSYSPGAGVRVADYDEGERVVSRFLAGDEKPPGEPFGR